jgi:hypothetical protein
MFRRSSRAALYVAGCLIAAPFPLAAHAQEAPVLPGQWRPWPENGAFMLRRDHLGRGERPAWAPILQNGHSLLFADIRPKLLDEEGPNAGIARDDTAGLLPGIWSGLGHRYRLRSNDFGGAPFAGERLTPDWTGRLDSRSEPLDPGLATASPAEAVEEAGEAEETDGTQEPEGLAILLLSRLDGAVLWGGDAAWAYRLPLEREGLARLAAAKPDEILLLALPEEETRAPLAGLPATRKPGNEEPGPRQRREWRVENAPAGQHGPRPAFDAGALYDHTRNAGAGTSADLPENGLGLSDAALDAPFAGKAVLNQDSVASIPDNADAMPPEGKCLINLGGVAGKIGFVEADGGAANCN